MGLGRRIRDTVSAPSRGVRRGTTVLVALSVGAASSAAVALSAPAFLADLVPPQEQPVAAPPVAKPVLNALSPTAPLPTEAGLATALDDNAAAMPGRFAGVVLDPVTGTVLWERDPARALVPGSAGKILTTAAALLTLDPSDTLDTLAVTGPEPGTVVLVGGGDPTLTGLAEGEGVYPDPARLTVLAEQVRRTAEGPVDRVLVDTSRYRGPAVATGWVAADIAGGFVAPIESLMVDGGRADPRLQDGPRVSEPAVAAGRAFAELLGVDPDTVAEGAAPLGAERLGAVSSAPVTDLVEHVIRSSDNVLAEAIAREVAISRKGDPTFTGAAEQTLAALDRAGFDSSGAVLVDGSGLSTEDRVPARLLGALLAAAAGAAPTAADTEVLRPVLTGLPVAGGDGTLDDRFGRGAASAPGRGVVRAKTGTLTSVSSLAGVVTDADGRLLVFALLSNGASPAAVRPRLDAVAAELSRCGCR